MKRHRWRSAAIAVGRGLGVVLASGAGLHAGGVIFNTTPSIPGGVYLLRNVDVVQRGDLVAACVPEGRSLDQAYDRGYLGPGICAGWVEPVLKPVAAVPGDIVEVTEDGVRVDGVLIEGTARFREDSKGRPLAAVPPGTRVVPAGEVWLLATYHPRSFDSRYWGGVPISAVRGGLTPVWVSP